MIDRLIIIYLCISMVACSTMDTTSHNHYQRYGYAMVNYYSGNNYNNINAMRMDNTRDYFESQKQENGQTTVPESYHVDNYHSPVSAKDRDRDWVASQNSQGYTIEIANDEKPSLVAKKLYQTPKNERTAEIKYQHEGKAYYKGLYGSYASQEEAQKALNSLPDDVKQGANIKSWEHLQKNISD